MGSSDLIGGAFLVLISVVLWVATRQIIISADKYPPAIQGGGNPVGVRGWLLVLCVVLMALPLFAFGRIQQFWDAERHFPALLSSTRWIIFKDLSLTVAWTAAALNFSAGVGLVKRRDPVAVRRAIAILWIAGPLADVLREFVVPLLAAVHTPKPDSSFIWSTIAAGAWTAYLYRSKRVRVTYGTVTR